jgi:hypothetical protein
MGSAMSSSEVIHILIHKEDKKGSTHFLQELKFPKQIFVIFVTVILDRFAFYAFASIKHFTKLIA